MTHDPKLVEAVARGLKAADEDVANDGYYRIMAVAALAAINGSGTHWVAPTTVALDGFSADDIKELTA